MPKSKYWQDGCGVDLFGNIYFEPQCTSSYLARGHSSANCALILISTYLGSLRPLTGIIREFGSQVLMTSLFVTFRIFTSGIKIRNL